MHPSDTQEALRSPSRKTKEADGAQKPITSRPPPLFIPPSSQPLFSQAYLSPPPTSRPFSRDISSRLQGPSSFKKTTFTSLVEPLTFWSINHPCQSNLIVAASQDKNEFEPKLALPSLRQLMRKAG